MKKVWEQLKPSERRGVIAIGVVLFLVLNYFMVWPQFGQWSKVKGRKETAEGNIKKYQAELAHRDEYTRKIANFNADPVPAEDQVIHFQNFILDRATENGIRIDNTSAPRKSTNDEFFLEQQEVVQASCSEPSLVNFLYSLGTDNSMMRVRTLVLRTTDLNRFTLHADVTIVASYQKSAPTIGSRAPAARTATPAPTPVSTKPAATPTPATTPAPVPITAGPNGMKPRTVTNNPATPNIKRP